MVSTSHAARKYLMQSERPFCSNEKILLNESFYTINSNSPLSNLHTPTENQHSFYFFQNFTNSTSSIVWKLKTQMRWEFLRTLVCYLRKICKRHLSQYWTQYIRISGKDGYLWTGGNWETEMNAINLDMSDYKLMLPTPRSSSNSTLFLKREAFRWR